MERTFVEEEQHQTLTVTWHATRPAVSPASLALVSLAPFLSSSRFSTSLSLSSFLPSSLLRWKSYEITEPRDSRDRYSFKPFHYSGRRGLDSADAAEAGR